jgi:hypothetical protein
MVGEVRFSKKAPYQQRPPRKIIARADVLVDSSARGAE